MAIQQNPRGIFWNQIQILFDDLEKKSNLLEAKFNWTCCQTCGWADLEEFCVKRKLPFHDDTKNMLFSTHQDCERAFDTDDVVRPKRKLKEKIMVHELFFAWAGDGHAIRTAIESYGYKVKWDGKSCTRMCIKPTKSQV